jgi:hypothetical protein
VEDFALWLNEAHPNTPSFGYVREGDCDEGGCRRND